jgi:hypothetical protein
MKKTKHIIDNISTKLSYDKEIIETVIDFYWSTVRKKVSSLDYHRVYLEYLGDLYVRLRPLEGFVKRQTFYVNKLDQTNFQNFPKYQDAKERLEKMERVYEVIKSEMDRQNQIKNERDTKS